MTLKEIIEQINTPNTDYPRIKNSVVKVLLMPFMVVWFAIQLFMCSFIGGGILVVLAIMGLLSEIFKKPEDRDWGTPLSFLILPIAAPFIWWYRYFKFGEYNLLIED